MLQNVENKTVAITGASSGLGAETARELVAAGAKVALGARRLDRLEALAEELGPENCAVFRVDVTKREQVHEFVEAAVGRYGRLDVMMNNAGLMPLAPLEEQRYDEWDRCIDVNMKGVLWGIGAALPHFKAQKSGHFINVASVAGHSISPGAAVYAATKHGVRVISEALRQEVKPYNIRTTIISPGAVATELPNSVRSEGLSERIGEFYKDVALPPSSFARCVLFAIGQPEELDINEILFRPTAPGKW